MKIGVTGGSGFIGTPLIQAIERSFGHVRMLSRRPYDKSPTCDVVFGDLTHDDPSALDAFVSGLDCIIHCAGELRNEGVMEALHVEGTRRLLAASLRMSTPARWVQLSSVGVYGGPRSGVVTEESPLRPRGMYEKTKAASDALVLAAVSHHRHDALIVRPSIVIGKSMPGQSFVQLANAIRNSRYVHLGDDSTVLNFVDVDEVVTALLQCVCAESGVGPDFIVSQHCTVREFETWVRPAGALTPIRRVPLSVAVAASLVPGSPLTRSRRAALTSSARYDSSRIVIQLGHTLTPTIEQAVLGAFFPASVGEASG